jgi:ribose/xylose/arabinose/galactoside ABC-type transport system permease subunit
MTQALSSPAKPAESGMRRWYHILVERRDLTLLLMIVVMIAAITRVTPHFLTIMNLRTMGLATAFPAIVVIGMTVLMIGGGIDLSVGSTYGLASIVVGMWISAGLPLVPGLVIGLLIGLGIGLINASLVNRFMLSPFLATLGTMSIFRGIIWVISGGHSIVGMPDSYTALGQTKILTLQLPVYIMLVFVIIADFLLRRSTFWHQSYYIGINRGSAVAAGINVARATGAAYVLSAILAATAGMLDGARLGAVYIQAGSGLEFQVITGAVIGGTALSGGRGTIFGSFLGVIVMVMLTNVFNLVGISIYWQNVLVGVILIAVVGLDRLLAPKEAR